MTNYKVTTPNKSLSSELFSQENKGCQLFTIENELFISGFDTLDEAKAALEAHNPPEPIEPTVAEKLASLGLSVADLKAALS